MRPSSHRLRLLEQRADEMRRTPTTAEARLFEGLRCGKLGVSFRRQVPLQERFIADFYAPAIKLVIEVDGAYHEATRDADARRDRALAKLGCHVLRVSNLDVFADLPAVVERVAALVLRLRGLRAGR